MKKFEREVCNLTDSQLEVFRNLSHCLNAARFCIDTVIKSHDDDECKLSTAHNFIQQVLFELEDRKKLEYRMYENIAKDNRLSEQEMLKLDINPDNGKVHILTDEYFKESQEGRLDLRKFDIMWRS